MPFGGVNPNCDRERLTRSNLAWAVFVKRQYTPIGFDIEVSVMDTPILEPLAAVFAPYQRLVHPEALRVQWLVHVRSPFDPGQA